MFVVKLYGFCLSTAYIVRRHHPYIEISTDSDNIQMSWKRFKSAFLDVMEQWISRSVLPPRNNLPWLTKEIIQLIRRRNHHVRKANCSGDRDDYLKFRQVRYGVVAELRLAKRRYFANLHPHNQREFWKTVKSLTPKENSIPTLSGGNIVASTNPEKACLLNVTFTKCLNYSLPGLSVANLPNAVPHECSDNFLCTEDVIYKLLCSLDPSKANDHDDISARMLEETALSITPAVTQLFNISIQLGELPEEWKTAHVTPIPKLRDHSTPENYLPILLLS